MASPIISCNKPLTAWGHVLHDDHIAHAIVDRVLERGRLLTLYGPSMRASRVGLDDPTAAMPSQVVKLSGTREPEFPEPTAISLAQ